MIEDTLQEIIDNFHSFVIDNTYLFIKLENYSIKCHLLIQSGNVSVIVINNINNDTKVINRIPLSNINDIINAKTEEELFTINVLYDKQTIVLANLIEILKNDNYILY